MILQWRFESVPLYCSTAPSSIRTDSFHVEELSFKGVAQLEEAINEQNQESRFLFVFKLFPTNFLAVRSRSMWIGAKMGDTGSIPVPCAKDTVGKLFVLQPQLVTW